MQNLQEKGYLFFSISSGGRLILFCEPCFQTLNVLYKREIRHREEEQQEEYTILEDEFDED